MIDFATVAKNIITGFAPGTHPLTEGNTGMTKIGQADEYHVSVLDVLPTEETNENRSITVKLQVEVSSADETSVPGLMQEIVDAFDRFTCLKNIPFLEGAGLPPWINISASNTPATNSEEVAGLKNVIVMNPASSSNASGVYALVDDE